MSVHARRTTSPDANSSGQSKNAASSKPLGSCVSITFACFPSHVESIGLTNALRTHLFFHVISPW
eukprot:6428278-Amphidinium_carterae.2